MSRRARNPVAETTDQTKGHSHEALSVPPRWSTCRSTDPRRRRRCSQRHCSAVTCSRRVDLESDGDRLEQDRGEHGALDSLSPTKFQVEGLIYMSYVQAAEYNAVTAISGRYTPYNSTLTAPAGASPRAAVAAAAYTTLAYYFPTLAPSLVSTYTDYLNVTLAPVPEKARLAGIAVGAAAASQLIASRFGDGRNAAVATAFGVAPQPPGTWVFAPPPSAQSAQTPWVAAMKPFMLTSADQFRAPAPPAIDSPEYAAGLNEVETMGGATGTRARPRRLQPRSSGTRTLSISTTRSSATSQPTAASTSSTPFVCLRWAT